MKIFLAEHGIRVLTALCVAFAFTTMASCTKPPADSGDDTMMVLSGLTAEQQEMGLLVSRGIYEGDIGHDDGVTERKDLCKAACTRDYEGRELDQCNALCDCQYDEPSLGHMVACYVRVFQETAP